VGAGVPAGGQTSTAHAAGNNTSYSQPTWWAKYQALTGKGAASGKAQARTSVGANVDVSNETTPQSETSIAIDPSNSARLVAGSNEIVRDPMRAYYSMDGGATWGADDVPLPAPVSNNGSDFGSDPGVAFDRSGAAYYSYIVVFFSAGGLNGTCMAVARSTDGGKTWPQVTYFDFQQGKGVFDDKPYLAVDTNPGSPFQGNVYVTYDHTSNMSGRSSAHNAAVIAVSTDGGRTFSGPQPLDGAGGGPVSDIATNPFTGPNGQVYVTWQDIQNSRVDFSASLDGGRTFSAPSTLHSTNVPYEVAVPAMAFRQALMYPSCGADTSSGANRGRLYCAWMDQVASGRTNIYLSYSDDGGSTWSAPSQVNDGPVTADHFNHWLSVDPVDGSVNVSYYDTRNDPSNLKTDVYFSRSTNGGTSFLPAVRVTNAQSDETSAPADLGNQYGDYEGIAAYGGVAHPIWTDGRYDATLGEEVFSATVTNK
jgi:hypothetical protein